jgi:DNA primase
LSGLVIIQAPEGEDVNSLYKTHGSDYFKEKIAGAQ